MHLLRLFQNKGVLRKPSPTYTLLNELTYPISRTFTQTLHLHISGVFARDGSRGVLRRHVPVPVPHSRSSADANLGTLGCHLSHGLHIWLPLLPYNSCRTDWLSRLHGIPHPTWSPAYWGRTANRAEPSIRERWCLPYLDCGMHLPNQYISPDGQHGRPARGRGLGLCLHQHPTYGLRIHSTAPGPRCPQLQLRSSRHPNYF